MWKTAFVGVYQLLNWKMHGETLKFKKIVPYDTSTLQVLVYTETSIIASEILKQKVWHLPLLANPPAEALVNAVVQSLRGAYKITLTSRQELSKFLEVSLID